jgi:hypothetical protein
MGASAATSAIEAHINLPLLKDGQQQNNAIKGNTKNNKNFD